MNKIPVGKTIAYAYRFTIGNLGAIIGLIWLPMVLITVGNFFAETFYSSSIMTAMAAGQAGTAGQAALSLLAWYAVSVLLSAVMYTAVTRQALGLRKGPAYYHFALGPAEFRLFGAMMAMFGILLVSVLAFTIVAGVLLGAGQTGSGLSAITALLTLLLALGAVVAVFYVIARFGFLLLPATVAEEKVGLARSWMLTRGNVGRIFVIGLATIGPVALAVAGSQIAILGPGFFMTALNTSVDPAVQAKIAAAQSQITIAHLPMMLGVSLLIAPFVAGLTLGPAAYAYRALVPGKPLEA